MADLDLVAISLVASVGSLITTITIFYLTYLKGGRLRVVSPTMAMQYADNKNNIRITFPLIFTNVGVKQGIIEGLGLDLQCGGKIVSCSWEFNVFPIMTPSATRAPAEPFSVSGRSSELLRCEFISQSPMGELKNETYAVTLFALVRHKWQDCTKFTIRVPSPTHILRNTRWQQFIVPLEIRNVKF